MHSLLTSAVIGIMYVCVHKTVASCKLAPCIPDPKWPGNEASCKLAPFPGPKRSGLGMRLVNVS